MKEPRTQPGNVLISQLYRDRLHNAVERLQPG